MSGPATGVYVSAVGAVGVVFLLCFGPLGKCFDDVQLVIYGIFVMVASCCMMLRKNANVIADDEAHYALWVTVSSSVPLDARRGSVVGVGGPRDARRGS